jgi:DNA-binding SARP family transcriptional activator
VLTPAECKRLGARMRKEAKKVAERAAAADLSDAVCRVNVLGRLEVIAPHGPVTDRDWCKRKARLLFAMLVARAGTDVPRGEIIEYLWPEFDEERALNNFYVVWSAMKRALAPDSIRETPCPFVEHVHGVCRIVPGRVITDLDEFDAHLAAARKARERGDAAAELSAIRAAEQVYRGDVLPGDIYDDWFVPVRLRCRHDFEDAMLRAAQILADSGEPHEGLSMLRRPMDNDVLREDFYQAALRLQIAAGQRSAAIATYMSCRSRLVEDLGIDPSRETTALYEQVLGMEEGPE